MFRHTVSRLSERTAHPLLAVLVGLGLVFVVIGLAIEPTGRGLTAGFLGVYASMVLFMGGVGYGLVLLTRGARKLWRQYDVAP